MNDTGCLGQMDKAVAAAIELYVTDETQLKAKILEWLTRTAIKAVSPKERKLHFEGINKLLGTNFTLEEMTDIYTYLGNGIKHDLCVKFVESGYDMTIIQKEG